MTKGMIGTALSLLVVLALPLDAGAEGEIWKVIDENGNVVYTDQPPADGVEPMDLPELSVIESDIELPEPPRERTEAEPGEEQPELTPRELRQKYRDFRITQPQPEETFWGTGNQVVVNWSSSQPIPPEMSVMLYVNGQPQKVPAGGGVTLTLDRGEHEVRAELRDANDRRIASTDSVRFFVKQWSRNFGGPGSSPGGRG